MKMRRKIKNIVFIIIIVTLSFIIALCCQEIRLQGNYSCTITEIDENTITGAWLYLNPYGFKYSQKLISDNKGNRINLSELSEGDNIYVYNETKHISYVCTVVNIEGEIIYVEEPELRYYSFKANDATIKDINGKGISIYDLSSGDRINITNKKEKIQPSIARSFEGHSLEFLQNVKNIEISEKDLNEQNAIANKNLFAIKRGIILEVNENSLNVMGVEDTTDIFSVITENDKDIKFKQGQEILIYFNGFIDSITHVIDNVGKIEILI